MRGTLVADSATFPAPHRADRVTHRARSRATRQAPETVEVTIGADHLQRIHERYVDAGGFWEERKRVARQEMHPVFWIEKPKRPMRPCGLLIVTIFGSIFSSMAREMIIANGYSALISWRLLNMFSRLGDTRTG
jgi:hypothetical protein